MAAQEDCDVIVIGGGPGGATVSYLLAEKGFKVFLIEKDTHPRFHVGESLLPSNLPLFEQIGVLPQVAEIGLPKFGAEFNSPDGDERVTFYFKETNKNYPPAFEITRADLDLLLLNNAASKGVKIFQNTRVVSADLNGKNGPTVVTKDSNGDESIFKSSFLIDSSGQDSFLANSLKLRIQNRKHASAAIFGHFKGVERREGKDAGNISIYWFPHGWLWAIPLKNGNTSVGVVCWPRYLKTRGKAALEEFFEASVKLCPNLAKRMDNAEPQSPIRSIGNYSYWSKKGYGKNFILIGDAFTFLDPIFSSGVYIAMKSAFLAAESVEACLKNPADSARILEKHEKYVRRGLKNLSWLIYRITTPAMRDLFLHPRNPLGMRDVIVSILAGKFFNLRWKYVVFTLFKLVYFWKCLLRPGQYREWRSEKMDF